ncbi:MAG: helix-turn-helix transcriptional regulator [Clostridia bacterium]|nr:helix-turn-helix transcriptional regulator [Clostridia bacterium]
MKRIIIAEKIKEYRRKNGLTQEEFGRLLGVSAQAISKWEREECYPDITFLPEIASLLTCNVDDFFEE